MKASVVMRSRWAPRRGCLLATRRGCPLAPTQGVAVVATARQGLAWAEGEEEEVEVVVRVEAGPGLRSNNPCPG